jgi:cobalt-zinc-cadmium efflux system membrane fusion protein
VLAYVVPSAGQIERSNQMAQLAELRAAKSLAEKRVARLKELADTVPRKDIEAAESELASAARVIGCRWRPGNARCAGGARRGRDRVEQRGGRAGRRARELVFEIVDPKRLRIEALAYDAAPGGIDVAGASLAVGEPARAARLPRRGAQPARAGVAARFRGRRGALARLAVGPAGRGVRADAQHGAGRERPAASLMKNPANQTIVWVKTAPERFEPRTVTTEPLDGANVAVTSGLKQPASASPPRAPP